MQLSNCKVGKKIDVHSMRLLIFTSNYLPGITKMWLTLHSLTKIPTISTYCTFIITNIRSTWFMFETCLSVFLLFFMNSMQVRMTSITYVMHT